MKKNIILLAGAAIAIIGCFLPWVSLGGMSVTGMAADGAFIIVMAVLAAGAGMLDKKVFKIISVVIAVLLLALSVKYFLDANSLGATGIGLIVLLVGSAAAAAGAVMGMLKK